MGFVFIDEEEYRKLVETKVRADLFADFVNNRIYINREDCAEHLGFELKKEEGENNA